MAQEDVASLRRLYEASLGRNRGELREAVSHDVELNLPESLPWGGVHHGPDGIEAVTEIFNDHVEGSWADPDEFLDSGDRIVVLGRAHGRARASGREFDVPFAHVWALSDGSPSWCRGFFDTAPVLAALRASSDEGEDAATPSR